MERHLPQLEFDEVPVGSLAWDQSFEPHRASSAACPQVLRRTGLARHLGEGLHVVGVDYSIPFVLGVDATSGQGLQFAAGLPTGWTAADIAPYLDQAGEQCENQGRDRIKALFQAS